ncbi:hypothetical protein GCM10025768_18010 [Microbacterium pseudoresistens]|uniref:AbiEi antitoxin C-terminal domain-containing protein n=1 Tax=Microbacterium pseudoresistens TaxID=640634 RepID=A0A7Y9JQA8_9MICO|nr:SAM-dependent methyltransferase [Microbacterium pseudoresistens]NYD55494.1 hypothetical protein [Microbacterium pseudoresistens]
MLADVHPTFVYRPGERLSLPELCAARLDGDVVELGECFIPADRVETAHLRAASIASVRAGREDLAFAGASAAWVHGAGAMPPEEHELQLTQGRRMRRPPSPRTRVHESLVAEDDVVRLDDILVVTAGRTMLDLLRWAHKRPDIRNWARAFAQFDPTLLDDADRRLRTAPSADPRGARARALLERLRGELADEPRRAELRTR